MKDANRDLFPTKATRDLYAAVSPLLLNPVIDEAFTHHESLAIRAKRQYHTFGRLSILLIAASAIYTIADALILPDFGLSRLVSGLMGLIAAFGISLQVFLLATKQKSIWLINRFMCERLRSLKFQAFALADQTGDRAVLGERVEAFSKAALSRLNNEMNAGLAMLEGFSARAALSVPDARKPRAETALSETAFSAFRELRIQYQARFAASEIHRLDGSQRYLASFSDMLYLAGAGLVLTALFFKLVFPDAEVTGAWIDFLASTTFIASIANAILDHGGLSITSRARFSDYKDGIDALPERLSANQKLAPVVEQMEALALEELRAFCESTKIISYRM